MMIKGGLFREILHYPGTTGPITSTVQRAASTRDTVPALAGLLIDVSDHVLTMTATDLELVIKSSTDQVNISETGRVLTNARYFETWYDSYWKPNLVYTDDENSRLVISYGDLKATLTCTTWKNSRR